MSTEQMTEQDNRHPFERQGLGKAPFAYIGQVHQDMMYGEVVLNRETATASSGYITTKPGGTCAYCGTYILNMFNVGSSDGQIFHVGSDCIMKVGQQADDKATRALVKAVKAAIARNAKERLAAKASAAKAFYATPDVQAYLTETRSMRLDFILAHAGDARIIKEINALRKEMGKV